MMIQYHKSPLSEVETFEMYLASLSSPIDGFLEDYILDSEFYRILFDGNEIGSFAIHESSLLT